MTGWKKCKLGDTVNLKRGYDLPHQRRVSGAVPLFSSSGISDYQAVALKEGPGVVTGRYGTVGQVFYSEGSYWPLNTTLYVQDFKGNLPRFIYYFLKGLNYEKYSDKSAVPGINRNELHKEEVILPTPGEQALIAEVLSSLDDKIDLLHRQNRTLEQLAQTLFRQWFVKEGGAGIVKPVSELVEHMKEGVTPYKEPTIMFRHFSIPAYDEGREPKLEVGKSILSNKYKVFPSTLLVSKLNPRTPRIWMIPENEDVTNSICSTEFQVLKPHHEKDLGFLFCFLNSDVATQTLAGAAGGTSGSHQRVNPEDILALEAPYSSEKQVDRFDETTGAFWQKISSNKKQIQTLTHLRDTLLPKLMSGEVRVKGA